MIALDEDARRAITNARALLDAMLAGGWAHIHVANADGEFFLTRDAGVPDPLIAPEPVQAAPAPVAPAAPPVAIRAPHVGTLAWLAPVGARLAEGDAAARLHVLDETVDVPAPAAGTVAAHGLATGDLAEYGSLLAELAP